MKKRKRISTKKPAKRFWSLDEDDLIEDGDECQVISDEEIWLPVGAEDIDVTVGDSGYYGVRRPMKRQRSGRWKVSFCRRSF